MTPQFLADRRRMVNQWLASADSKADVILAVLICLNLIPIWIFTYFPSLDGPAHVSLTWWLVHYNDPNLTILREFLEPNLRLVPNYLIFLILYPLMQVFPAVIAEKLLISLYAITLPLALRHAMIGIAPEARGLAVLGCVMTFHALLMLGFYNSSFAIAVFLLAIGYWLRRRHRLDLGTLTGYAAIGLLAYATHLSAVASICLAIFFATVGLAVGDLRTTGASAAYRRLVSHGVWPALGFGPVLVLCIGFILHRSGERAAEGFAGIGLPDVDRIVGLVQLDAFIGHDARELLISLCLVLTLYITIRLALRHGTGWVNPGLFVFAGFGLLYLITPYQFDVRWMPTRLMPYVVLGALLWTAGMMAGISSGRRQTITGMVVICATAMVIVGTGIRMVRWADIDSLLTEYYSANALIEPNSTLLALRLGREIDGRLPSDRVAVLLQMPGYIAAERGVLDLKHFQAKTGRFPLTFREEVDPYRHMADDAAFTTAPLTIDPGLYAERTGQTVDYVLLWGDEDHLPADPAETPLTQRLADDYDLIHVSAERGLARLYRLREP